MDWHTTLKFAHIVAAILWLGGAFAMLIAGMLVAGSPDRTGLARYLSMMDALGARLFMPASMSVLATGLAMSWLWFGFAEAWLSLALAGTMACSFIGMLFIKPAGRRIRRRVDAEGASKAVMVEMRGLTRIVRFEFAIMLTIVALMVFRPAWQNTATLLALGLFLGLAAALLLFPRRPGAAYAAV